MSLLHTALLKQLGFAGRLDHLQLVGLMNQTELVFGGKWVINLIKELWVFLFPLCPDRSVCKSPSPELFLIWQTLCSIVLLIESLPVLLEVFMMCGLLRRLSLDTILNLNLPLLACKQEGSCRQEAERTDNDKVVYDPIVHIWRTLTHICVI